MQDSEEPETSKSCPVCDRHSDDEAIASQQVVMLGAKAILEADDRMVEDIFASLTPFDGHVAISMLLMAISDIALITGQPLSLLVDRYREQLTNAQQEEAGPPTETPDSGHAGRHRRED